MSFAQLLILAVHLLFAVAGLVLIFVGAWGNLRVGRYGTDAPLPPKQRILVTVIGLFFLVAAWNYVSGWLPLGF
jgi:hypothetical protein